MKPRKPETSRARRGAGAAALFALLVLSAAGQEEDHSAHQAALAQPAARYAVTEAGYKVPDVSLLDQAGHEARLPEILEPSQPVALNFVFTTCTTICPVMTATFAQARRELGEDAARVRLVSISIDPQQDRPPVLKRYADRYGAGGGWTFLTGDAADVKRVLLAFSAYSGSKMNHRPVTFLRAARSDRWTRIDGLASGKDLASEIRARLLR
ncbi:MAG TPA: SCO family protein [Vicinamibacteria bacterium]|nr:SCO family protein [Vicinamibacteria bacterium]